MIIRTAIYSRLITPRLLSRAMWYVCVLQIVWRTLRSLRWMTWMCLMTMAPSCTLESMPLNFSCVYIWVHLHRIVFVCLTLLFKIMVMMEEHRAWQKGVQFSNCAQKMGNVIMASYAIHSIILVQLQCDIVIEPIHINHCDTNECETFYIHTEVFYNICLQVRLLRGWRSYHCPKTKLEH